MVDEAQIWKSFQIGIMLPNWSNGLNKEWSLQAERRPSFILILELIDSYSISSSRWPVNKLDGQRYGLKFIRMEKLVERRE